MKDENIVDSLICKLKYKIKADLFKRSGSFFVSRDLRQEKRGICKGMRYFSFPCMVTFTPTYKKRATTFEKKRSGEGL